MRTPLLLLALIAFISIPLTPAMAALPESLVIDADKPAGPFVGTFEASGAFGDEGTFAVVESRMVGAESERLLTSHLTYEFVGEGGPSGSLHSPG